MANEEEAPAGGGSPNGRDEIAWTDDQTQKFHSMRAVATQPSPPVKPNPADMERVFDLFRAAGRGKIELAWIERTEPFRLNGARQFDLGEFDELVDVACRLNADPNCNLYFSVGLRRDDASISKRASDGDVIAVTAIKADFDRQGAAEAARAELERAGLLPTHWAFTGHEPYLRAHASWAAIRA